MADTVDADYEEEEFYDEEEDVEMDENLGNVVLIENLPVVPPQKLGKLKEVIAKHCSRVEGVSKRAIAVPFDEERDRSKGAAFVEFSCVEAAELAVRHLNGFPFDKSHQLVAILLSDYDRIMEQTEELQPFQRPEFKESENLYGWMLDPRGREQYMIRYGHKNQIYWHDATQQSKINFEKDRWTEMFVSWSSTGQYMATVHPKGVQLWGGDDFHLIRRVIHPGVRLVAFSPEDKYLVTYSPTPTPEHKTVIIWDVRTGHKMREFLADPHQDGWPVFKWSHQDEYFARIERKSPRESAIAVYCADTQRLLDNQRIMIPFVKDFCWSPTDNCLVYWTPDDGPRPARITMMAIPSRTEVRSKTIFNVENMTLHWQDKGKYLCAVVVQSKSKTMSDTHLELFRVRDRNIPVQVLDIPDDVAAFAFEPYAGTRFAVVHGKVVDPSRGAGTVQGPLNVSFYDMGRRGDKPPRKLVTLTDRQCNQLFWSPRGRFIVLAGLKQFNGQLEFYDVNEKASMGVGEHFMCTDVHWDCSGRFLATSSSYFFTQLENGYSIWTFFGGLLEQEKRDHFWQFLWRPRPASLLPPEKEEEIRSTIKSRIERYEEEDKRMREALSGEELEKRSSQRAHWESFLQRWKELDLQEKAERDALQGYDSDAEPEYITIEEEYEVFLGEEEVVED